MKNASLQLTIRGLDPATKDALVKKANQQGLSLNKYAIKALRQSAGINGEDRYQEMKKFLDAHSMQQADKQSFDDAIAYSDRSSLEKQHHDTSI